MKIIEIAGGSITVEMQPEEAMDIARAFARVLALPYGGDDAKDRLYRTSHALFEALAVAGEVQYMIDGQDESASTLTAVRAVKR